MVILSQATSLYGRDRLSGARAPLIPQSHSAEQAFRLRNGIDVQTINA